MKKVIFFLSLLLTQVNANPPKTIDFTINKSHFWAVEVLPEKVSLHWKNNQGKPYNYLGALKSALEKKGKTVTLLMNAGIYSANSQPAGLHIQSGKQLKALNTKKGKGNFHLQPNGVFLITRDNNARILSTQAYLKRYPKHAGNIRLATQSGPMLLIDGRINTKFIPDSHSDYSRNGICTTPTHRVFFFITSALTTSNFFTFAKAAKKLGCDQALYLDGNISKLYARGINTSWHFRPFVAILAVVE